MTARAEIARLLAIFNDLSENDKGIVLKLSETIKKLELASKNNNSVLVAEKIKKVSV